jgi:hypothetical protein
MTTRVDMIRARQAEAENTVSLDQEMEKVVGVVEDLAATAGVVIPEDLSPSEMVRVLAVKLVNKVDFLEPQVNDLVELVEKIKSAEPEAYKRALKSKVIPTVDAYCRMVCPGGSEYGACPCTTPEQCVRKNADA